MRTLSRYDVLIVGSGHAGAQAAISLRQGGHEGSIAIVGAEDAAPYERPPLSKDYLSQERTFDDILIRPAEFWAERRIDLLPGRRVETVDAAGRFVVTASGEQIGYGDLIWAAGGEARRLGCPGADLEGVLTLRTRQDADALIRSLPQVRDVVIIGGGYIGLEAAAVLRKAGKAVTVLEAQDRVLARVAGEPLSRVYEARHRREGVDIRLGAQVEAISGADGRASGVVLAGGEHLPAQLVIVGIGLVASVAPLVAAGAQGENGVNVDAFCRTSLPHIYAAGDCAAQVSRYAQGARLRIESVQNAADQAAVAARHILGEDKPNDAPPWFWSHQYDLKLQTVGLSIDHDQIIQRGDADSGAFSLVYLKDNRVIALDCVNAAKDFAQGRKLVMQGVQPDIELLRDPHHPLKALSPSI